MSWDKNIINTSAINNTISVLEKLGTPYTVTTLGKVRGRGLNDKIWMEKNEDAYPICTIYTLRKLEYKDVVLLEKIIRNSDCDVDDFILSFEFKKGHEPRDWEIEGNND